MEERRRQVFQSLKAMFVGESQQKPVVVILEDIHWIDRTTEEFFLYLSSSVAENRIMILALHRPFYQCPWATSSSYLRIPVRPLSQAESEEMLHGVLGVRKVAREVKELVLHLLEADQLCPEGEVCWLVGSGVEVHVPATVREVIMARIDRLDETLKRTIQLAAVIGREFAYAVLEKIVEQTDELSPVLQALQRSELITEKNLFPELEYMFKNALIQDVAYNSLLLKWRRGVHGRIADAIEELKRDTLEEYVEMLAHHYKNGDRPEKAFEYLARAGEKAMELCSVDLAKNYFNEALAIAAALSPGESLETRERELRSRLEEIASY
ncbi:MAG: hypothetical protein JSV16_02765 [Candidatus Hydrogenedentota bacterium]|nr:MAG: hypothetical protein JSV16_02765 [Candidatus Hydrogenedentota bacterium]